MMRITTLLLTASAQVTDPMTMDEIQTTMEPEMEMSTSHEMMAGAFDPASNWLQITLNRCSIDDLSTFDIYNVITGVMTLINESCNTTIEMVDGLTDDPDLSICLLQLKTEDADAPVAMMDCLPLVLPYMEGTHDVVAYEPLMTAVPPMPANLAEVQAQLEAGMDDELLDDPSVIEISMRRPYDELLASFDEAAKTLNGTVTSIQSILREVGATYDVEAIGLGEDDDGNTVLMLRPVTSTAEDDAAVLETLRSMLANPDSALYSIDGVAKVTTTAMPTTSIMDIVTSTEMPIDPTDEAEQADEGNDGAIIGGVVGGLAALAAAGGAAAYCVVARRKKNVEPVVPNDASSTRASPQSLRPGASQTEGVVYTPGTRHSAELTDRTPRMGDDSPTRHE